jgi:GNAT superfamily N-acetyltransferase
MTPPEGYEIRAIGPDGLDAWWDLRLRSLRDHPDAFGADYASAIERGPDYLRGGLVDGAVERLFAAFSPDGSLVAQLRTVADTGKRSHIAMIISVATDPRHCGLSLQKALIRLAIDHCRSFSEIRQVHISVNAGNAPALAVYEGAGFVAWGREPRALRTESGFHDEIHLAMMLDGE